MPQDYTECPNCGTKIKSGLLSNITLLNIEKTKIINEYISDKKAAYCSKCGNDLYIKFLNEYTKELDHVTNSIYSLLDSIPVISIQSPQNWNYEIIEMVTGQSTTGTGVLSELTSSFNDLFGRQSNSFNEKLKAGEQLCFSQIRKQTLDLGGNAVIATDIDYSEVGGQKGMLMVCAGGTAITLLNIEIIGKQKAEKITKLKSLNERIKHLNTFNPVDPNQY